MTTQISLNGQPIEIVDDRQSLLEALRGQARVLSVKDGCSPQGQCGCCTVLVDGQPRVSCVTPVRRIAGREVTTVEGLPAEVATGWADALCATGGSQCGFCTPGIVARLEGLRAKGGLDDPAAVDRALAAHLCRCTGWQTIDEAAKAVCDGTAVGIGSRPRDLAAAARRAELEGGTAQLVGPRVALGLGGFAADTAPEDALVAVPDGSGGWAVGDTLAAARSSAGKVQGRRTTVDPEPPIALPPGDWHRTLQTSWVEPAYLETDAAWCLPGGEPASPLANGGAFGGKTTSLVRSAARELADVHGRPVLVTLAREDTVRLGPKRPPIAAGVRADGSGVVRVAATPGVADSIARVAPGLVVEEVEVDGPSTSTDLRAAGWAEAAVLLATIGERPGRVTAPNGSWAEASFGEDGGLSVVVGCGPVLDEVVLRSYCIGASHMALGWVTSESLTVVDGEVQDLTIRSFGIVRPHEMVPVEVEIVPGDGEPANGSDAVFAAVAAATWARQGHPPVWPSGVPVRA